MKDDFEQLEKGYILMLRLKDEEITRLKGMISESVRHGHWDILYNDNIPYTLKCSECGEYTIVNGKYCPNCGCKMDLDEVENGTDSKNTR